MGSEPSHTALLTEAELLLGPAWTMGYQRHSTQRNTRQTRWRLAFSPVSINSCTPQRCCLEQAHAYRVQLGETPRCRLSALCRYYACAAVKLVVPVSAPNWFAGLLRLMQTAGTVFRRLACSTTCVSGDTSLQYSS